MIEFKKKNKIQKHGYVCKRLVVVDIPVKWKFPSLQLYYLISQFYLPSRKYHFIKPKNKNDGYIFLINNKGDTIYIDNGFNQVKAEHPSYDINLWSVYPQWKFVTWAEPSAFIGD